MTSSRLKYLATFAHAVYLVFGILGLAVLYQPICTCKLRPQLRGWVVLTVDFDTLPTIIISTRASLDRSVPPVSVTRRLGVGAPKMHRCSHHVLALPHPASSTGTIFHRSGPKPLANGPLCC